MVLCGILHLTCLNFAIDLYNTPTRTDDPSSYEKVVDLADSVVGALLIVSNVFILIFMVLECYFKIIVPRRVLLKEKKRKQEEEEEEEMMRKYNNGDSDNLDDLLFGSRNADKKNTKNKMR